VGETGEYKALRRNSGRAVAEMWAAAEHEVK